MRRMMVKLDNSPYPNSIWFTNSEILFNRKRTELTGSEPLLYPGPAMCSRTHDCGSMVIGVFDGQAITTVHEISHAVINVFEYVGMEVNNWTTEAFAYLHESLCNQAIRHQTEWHECD